MIFYHNEISLGRRTIVRSLSAAAVFILVASVAGQVTKYEFGHDTVYGLINLFYVDRESNIPTFFSSTLLLLASLLLAFIARLKKQSHDAHWHQWAILSFALMYMAVDEASGIHEMFNNLAKSLLGSGSKGSFTAVWVIFGIPFVLIFALSYLKFFLSLPPQTRRHLFAAAAIFFSGSLGMEVIGGFYTATHGTLNFQYTMLATVEEGLEMAGVITLINALLTYIIDHHEVRVRLDHF